MRLGRLRHEAKYLAIQELHTQKGWSIRWMCRKLRISRQAYYNWLRRTVPKAEQDNIVLAQLIGEYDDRFRHILGYRRMTDWINRLNGMNYNRKRIHRLMKKLDIRSVIRRKRAKYTYSRPETLAENILARNFLAEKPNQKWATDVTEVKWYEGPLAHKLYISAIIDLYDRSIVAYVISRKNNNRLVLDTFDLAIKNNPGAKPIFHSDRGFQYTSKVFQAKLAGAEMPQSMSRVSHCIDNGPTEGFWGILKSEMYHLRKFTNEASLRKAIDEYMHFYNYERFQERFGVRTPMEVRQAAFDATELEIFPIAPNKRIQSYKAKIAAKSKSSCQISLATA